MNKQHSAKSAYPGKPLIKERQKTGAKLQKMNDNLVYTLQKISDGFSIVDRKSVITFINDKLVAMAGGTLTSEYVGNNLWDCFPEAISSNFFPGYHKALAENTVVSIEDYYTARDKWFEVNVYPDEKGLCFFVRDITERKQNETRLEFVAKAAAEVIWEQNIDTGKVKMDGEKCKQSFGYEIKDNSFPRSFWQENIHPDDIKLIEENKGYAIEHNLDFYLNEYRFKKADGNWAWLKDRIYTVKGLKGRAISLIGATEDVTNKRLAEIAFNESEINYRQLFNNSPLPTVIAEVNSMCILAFNTATIEQYGYGTDELLSMTLPDFLPKDQHERLRTQKDKVESGMRNNLGTIYHVKKNGEKILVEISVTLINYKCQEAFLATAKDITEREKLLKAMVEQKVNYQKSITKAIIDTQEKERNEIGKELHDNVSQLLATAKMYVESLKKFAGPSNSYVDTSINLLNESIKEIRRLSHDMVTPMISDTGFKDRLLELIETYHRLKTFMVNYVFDFDEIVIDNGLKLTIYRVLQEQFHNTIKHAKASVVHIEIRKIRNSILLTYEDNGIGFYPSTAKEGIGQKNIANRVNAYNGKLKIKSAIGKGYKMKVLFPIEKQKSGKR